jgi:hypothetical protein
VLGRNDEVLDVQDYLYNVFFHTRDGGEFVADTLDPNVGNRGTWNRT